MYYLLQTIGNIFHFSTLNALGRSQFCQLSTFFKNVTISNNVSMSYLVLAE